MPEEKQITHISKFLSLVLRHKPETIGIQLDENGWTDVDELIAKANSYGVHFDRDLLHHIVATNAKKRFVFDHTLNNIRASQGHSIDIDLGYSSQQPPQILFHGTALKFAESILQTGLQKQSRQHVHLSSDVETAITVGERHGKPIVFIVHAERMFANHFQFYKSDNGVWLTDHVPVAYLEKYHP